MEVNFRGVNPELQTLCKYKFPKVAENNCSRFASSAKKSPQLYLGDGDFEGEEDFFFDGEEQKFEKRHVFANVWERSLDPRGGCGVEASTETWTIDWRAWPPDVPKISQGVKIPVELMMNMQLQVMEAAPVSSGSASFYQSLKGLFNPCQTSSIQVHPPALLFLNSRVGQFYSVKLRLKNVDGVPRRVKIVPPKNICFQVTWTSPQTTIIPGNTIPITVQYRPKTNASLNELLFIAVEGDGGLTVPLVAASEPPPILEFDEWDCGCSTLHVPRTGSFDIKNIGSEGRFWLLTEDEFRHQYLAYPKRPVAPAELSARPEDLEPKRRSSLKTKKDGESEVRVTSGPFMLNTACFKLLRNQKIQVLVKYVPKTAGLHYEKLAVMCDNGEVRWIAVKGMGIDMKSKGLVELKTRYYWTAPPIDLPFEEKCQFAIDFADLLPGAVGQSSFQAINKSCITMYYLWSVRPLDPGFAQGITREEKNCRFAFERFLEGTLDAFEGDDKKTKSRRKQKNKEVVDLQISPAQGILKQREAVDYSVSAACPQEMGYYACVLSLYIEQVEDDAVCGISTFLKSLESSGLSNVPIHMDYLKKALCPVKSETSKLIRQLKPLYNEEEEEEWGGEYEDGEEEEEEEEQGEEKQVENMQFILKPKVPKPCNKEAGKSAMKVKAKAGVKSRVAASKNIDLSQPCVEIEVWLRSMQIDVGFNPPFIVASGMINSSIMRQIDVYNNSQWPVEIELRQMMNPAGSICCAPSKLTLEPLEEMAITAMICLKSHGMIYQDVVGTMNVVGSSTKVPISINCSISSQGPYITTLTPQIVFGFVQINTETMKTIAIKNTGNRPARWIASVNKEDLHDDEGHNLTPYNCNIKEMNLLRVWPSWGVLEPQETMGINVYFSAEIEGDIAASIKVCVEKVPDSELYISVCAVVQNPFMYLEESEIFLNRESLESNNVEDAISTLANPTGFPIAFAWQPCLIGRQSQHISVEFCPETGFVPPRGTMDCILSLTPNTDACIDLQHVYAVCMVDGMKEPLILKISSDSD